jgi:hypothetical protein
MDKRTENIDQLFETLRETPAMSVGELEAIVAKREVSTRRRPAAAVWGGMTAVLILVGAGTLLMQGDEKIGQPAHQQIAASAGAPKTINASPAPARESHTEKMADAGSSQLRQQQSGEQVAPARKKWGTVRSGRRYNTLSNAPEPRREAETEVAQQKAVQTMSFNGNKLIELTPEELAVIGVRVAGDGYVEYFQKYKSYKPGASARGIMQVDDSREGTDWVWSTDASVRKTIHHRVLDSVVDSDMMTSIDERIVISYLSFAPSHVTDPNGKRLPEQARFTFTNPDSSMAPQQHVTRFMDSVHSKTFGDPLYMSRLIPIRVRTSRREVILWYFPRPELLGALPHRVQLQLRDEVESIESGIFSTDTALANYRTWISRTRYELDSILAASRPLASPNIDEEDPAVTGSCYLSFCTITSGGVNGAPIFPNPAHDAVTIGYRLLGSRIVTITLHDINGAPVRQLVGAHPKNAGRWETRASLLGVKPGIYLVVISTEKGEQVVQRLIVD